MTPILASQRELLLNRIEDDGLVLKIFLCPLTHYGGRVVPDSDAAEIIVSFKAPVLYQVMDEVIASLHGLTAPVAHHILFEVEVNDYMESFKLSELYAYDPVRNFLLVTAHSVVWISCRDEPAIV